MQHTTVMNAPNRSTCEAQDADEHAHNLTNWQQEYDQLRGGGFYGRIDEIALVGCQVFREHTNRALRQQCNVWNDALWLGIPVRTSECRINGLPLESGQLMCRPGGRDFELVTPDGFDIFGIVIREDMLLHLAERQGRTIDLARLIESPRLSVGRAELERVRMLLGRLVDLTSLQLDSAQQRQLAGEALLDLLDSSQQTDQIAPSQARRKKVVDRIKELIQERPDADLSIPALCEYAHVSRRTLQYCFESVLGMSPVQFLRTARLNQVRRALASGEPDDTVSVVATRYGFRHAGQFASDYKALFGENPSETLRRVPHGRIRSGSANSVPRQI
jgi:AraC family transcriptional regulator, ethanolamine operon transcriptional activator